MKDSTPCLPTCSSVLIHLIQRQFSLPGTWVKILGGILGSVSSHSNKSCLLPFQIISKVRTFLSTGIATILMWATHSSTQGLRWYSKIALDVANLVLETFYCLPVSELKTHPLHGSIAPWSFTSPPSSPASLSLLTSLPATCCFLNQGDMLCLFPHPGTLFPWYLRGCIWPLQIFAQVSPCNKTYPDDTT